MSALAAELTHNCNHIPHVYIFLQYMGEKFSQICPNRSSIKEYFRRCISFAHTQQFWSLTWKSVYRHIRGGPNQSGIVLEGGLCQTVSVICGRGWHHHFVSHLGSSCSWWVFREQLSFSFWFGHWSNKRRTFQGLLLVGFSSQFGLYTNVNGLFG